MAQRKSGSRARKQSSSSSSRSKRRKNKGARRLLFVIIFAAMLFVGHRWYLKQDRPTQEKVEAVALLVVDFLREYDDTPREVVWVLDWMADHVPLNVGVVVDVGQFEGKNEYVFAGLPDSGPVELRILENKGYLVGYDESMKNPAWVAYRLDKHDFGETAPRPPEFSEDRRVRGERVVHEDYTGTGYDRGHMAPNYGIGVIYGEEAQRETFLMTNIVPQKPDLNQGLWRELEQRAANRFTHSSGDIWVITGPVYNDPKYARKLRDKVAIPDAFYKIYVDERDGDGIRALAFIIPQSAPRKIDPEIYLTTIDDIEMQTRLDFLTSLPDEAEETLESKANKRVW